MTTQSKYERKIDCMNNILRKNLVCSPYHLFPATDFDIVANTSTKTLRVELDILVELEDYVETRLAL